MPLYAVDEIEEAVRETRELLFPFNRKTWLKLLLIVFITGSGMNLGGNSADMLRFIGQGSSNELAASPDYGGSRFQSSFEPINRMTGLSTASPGLAPVVILLLLLPILAFVLLLKLFMKPFFEFVYYQSLLDKNVEIRENTRKHYGKGVRYFGFLVITASIKYIPLFAGLYLLATGSSAAGIMVLFPWMLFLLLFNPFLGLTHNFILPRMIETDSGITDSWKSLYPDLRDQWKQVFGYIFIRAIIKTVIRIGTVLVALIGIIALGIPLVLLGWAAYALGGWLLVAPIAVMGVLAALVLILVIGVFTQTFLRYYAILVYHDISS